MRVLRLNGSMIAVGMTAQSLGDDSRRGFLCQPDRSSAAQRDLEKPC